MKINNKIEFDFLFKKYYNIIFSNCYRFDYFNIKIINFF